MIEPEKFDLLIVDDDDEFRSTLVRRFTRRGYHVEESSSGAAALQMITERHYHVVILDLVMPGLSGLEVLERLRQTDCDCQVLLLTGQGTIETAVQAMKLGACDYLTKPFPLGDLEVAIERASERGSIRKENQNLREVLHRAQPKSEIIGDSAAMQEVFRLIEKAGPSESAILIQGESGTGKELVARALHRHSLRADKPLVAINCAALPETLLESELFGHEKGAFTGAVATKKGLFELADGGTLFIDEIGEMPPALQAKLLRVLENGEMRRVGSLQERRVDVRLLAATNRDMEQEVRAHRFREDLFYRINVMSLELPPLRERKSDIPLLLNHFLGDSWKVAPDAIALMERYDWPGNVRQLANVIERSKILATGGVITANELPKQVRQHHGDGAPAAAMAAETDDLAAIEKSHIQEVLNREGGNKARTARALGVNRRSLYRLLEKYEIEVPKKN